MGFHTAASAGSVQAVLRIVEGWFACCHMLAETAVVVEDSGCNTVVARKKDLCKKVEVAGPCFQGDMACVDILVYVHRDGLQNKNANKKWFKNNL